MTTVTPVDKAAAGVWGAVIEEALVTEFIARCPSELPRPRRDQPAAGDKPSPWLRPPGTRRSRS